MSQVELVVSCNYCAFLGFCTARSSPERLSLQKRLYPKYINLPAGAHVELAEVDVEGLSKEELLLELKKVISAQC